MRRIAGLAALLLLVACPRPPRVPARLPVSLEPSTHHDEFALAGVIHVVRPGETVWRIARAYGIDAADLLETNGLADARALAAGAELFVPGATRVVEVPPAGEGAAPAATPASATAPGPAAGGAPAPAPAPAPGPAPAQPPAPAPPARPRGDASADARLAWPLEGVLYGRYGVRAGKRHDGIDIAAPEGTRVRAAGDGLVIYAGEQAGYGAIVILRHEGGLVTLYAHNSKLLVREGDRVRRGDPIARVGQTGRTSGPHLHFEVREGTRPKNPLLFLP